MHPDLPLNQILIGDCRELLKTLPDESVHCIVTSPPYWGLRSYGTDPQVWQNGHEPCIEHVWESEAINKSGGYSDKSTLAGFTSPDTKGRRLNESGIVAHRDTCSVCGAWRGELGLEPTPELYVEHLTQIFREVKRVLRPDGVLFLNLGDSYWGAPAGNKKPSGFQQNSRAGQSGALAQYNPNRTSSLQYSSRYAILREDLTDEEVMYVALEVRRELPDLWQACWGETSEGDVPILLSQAIQEGASRTDARIAESLLSPQSAGVQRTDQEAESSTPDGDDRLTRRQVRLLRGDREDVSMSRPHQGRGTERIPEGWRPERCLETSISGGIAEGQVSRPLLELQRGIRLVRFLSSLRLEVSYIPPSIKAYFKEEVTHNLKPKDLVGIPWMVAFALRADGWYLRSDIIWAKPNPMPESVTDRPTKAHEYIFLLSKRQKYYYDADAVKETATQNRWGGHAPIDADNSKGDYRGLNRERDMMPEFRNRRTVWTVDDERALLEWLTENYPDTAQAFFSMQHERKDVWQIATHPFKGAHFATFPPKLIEPCILAGTSARGVCPKCGAPWERVIEKGVTLRRTAINGMGNGELNKSGRFGDSQVETTGWHPTCACDAGEPVPAVVLDPFIGSGTTASVCISLKRHYIGFDLNPAYVEGIAQDRADNTPPPLFVM